MRKITKTSRVRRRAYQNPQYDMQPVIFGRSARALVRAIDPSLVQQALRGSAQTQLVDIARAAEQHAALVAAIRECGVEVTELPSDGFADSVFIEDTCVYARHQACVTQPGAPARRGECERVYEALGDLALNDWSDVTKSDSESLFVARMASMDEDALLDGGDVMYTGLELIVGESARTNAGGIAVLRDCFPDMPVTSIDISGCGLLHLKSACSMAGTNHLLFGGEVGAYLQASIAKASVFHYDRTTLLPDMAAANAIFVNDTLIRRADEEFPASADALRAVGGRQLSMVADELAKVDGALTCCALFL